MEPQGYAHPYADFDSTGNTILPLFQAMFKTVASNRECGNTPPQIIIIIIIILPFLGNFFFFFQKREFVTKYSDLRKPYHLLTNFIQNNKSL
jgi:hypothetical protein